MKLQSCKQYYVASVITSHGCLLAAASALVLAQACVIFRLVLHSASCLNALKTPGQLLLSAQACTRSRSYGKVTQAWKGPLCLLRLQYALLSDRPRNALGGCGCLRFYPSSQECMTLYHHGVSGTVLRVCPQLYNCNHNR